MKAQSSVEYLLLFAVSLVILIIIMQSMSYLSGMINTYEKRSHSLIAKELFLSTARDICYIGEGSSLIIQLSDGVEVKENRINNIPYEMPCSIAEGNFSGMVVLQNRDGNITAVSIK
jgi:hypothetical protein